METSILLQHLHAARLDQERRDKELLNEQLRIARMTRPAILDGLRSTIGDALIAIGRRLTQESAIRTSPRTA